jgi:hypothetical protein
LPNTTLPPNVWVDLYADTGLAVGSQIVVQNVGVCDVFLAAQAATPTTYEAHQIIQRGQYSQNDLGDAGAWAFCLAGGALNVRPA